MNLPNHWSLIFRVIRPLFSLTTIPSTSTSTMTFPSSTVRLPVWSSLLISYQRDDEVIYNGRKYRCVTSHRSYAGAEPGPLTWALWQQIS